MRNISFKEKNLPELGGTCRTRSSCIGQIPWVGHLWFNTKKLNNKMRQFESVIFAFMERTFQNGVRGQVNIMAENRTISSCIGQILRLDNFILKNKQ